jgi:hypothetical protein
MSAERDRDIYIDQSEVYVVSEALHMLYFLRLLHEAVPVKEIATSRVVGDLANINKAIAHLESSSDVSHVEFDWDMYGNLIPVIDAPKNIDPLPDNAYSVEEWIGYPEVIQ